MFKPNWTHQVTQDYENLGQAAARAFAMRRQKGKKKRKKSKQEGLFRQIDKTVRFLLDNPRRPGLQTHPYDSMTDPFDASKKVFEAYSQNDTPGAYRIFWCYGPKKKQITILAITPHP